MRHVVLRVSFASAFTSLASASAAVIHVPADQPNLKAAIAAATSGDEILVADGTYLGPDNRGLSFGGKNLFLHSANGPAACIIDCESLDRAFLFQSGETDAAIVEGLTIRNGKPASLNGGAVLVNGGAATARPTLRKCVFQDNSAPNGGAVAVNGNSDPTIVDCQFIANKALPGGVNGFGGAISLNGVAVAADIVGCTFDSNSSVGGGAIHKNGLSQPTIDRCTFIKNSTTGNGGAVSLTSASFALVSNCAFYGNTSAGTGGGAMHMSASGSTSTVVNCIFSGNKANNTGLGGGVLITTGSTQLLNCTIAGNAAGAINLGGALAKLNGASCAVKNCILWGNFGNQIQSPGDPAIDVQYSIVQGGFGGVANLAFDPLLVDVNGADDVPGTPDDDLRVFGPSPAIDSGSNAAWTVALTTDFAGLPRFYDDLSVPNRGEGRSSIIDRGAYETQPNRPGCASGDIDCDGDVDATDLALLLGGWGTDDPDADLDGDGVVAASDLAVLLGAWTG
ncbi:MAG: right-handed parallel beta-helix repeat-containing protein [Phycisphaerae bacterium]|jgi:predicted outer membrane repeat protein|nr:right-handed parallel beta-helix repeat-containing protein [Phycisphaerae bacterium]